MGLAGHSMLTTTLRYMHLVPGAATAAVAKLECFDGGHGEQGQDRGSGESPGA
jgi:hypothetical protein